MANTKTTAAITIGRIAIGGATVRNEPPTISAGVLNTAGVLVGPKNPYEPWTVFPILVDGKEVIALSRADARRFAQALLREVE